MLATDYAKYYGISPQAEGESDHAFRERVSGALRSQGKLIEAHEAFQDARYDDPGRGGDVQTGIMGALAFALEGRGFRGDPVRPCDGAGQVGDDIAAGTLAQAPKKPQMSPEMALLALALFGGRD